MNAIDRFEFEQGGRVFVARIYADDLADAPWENEDRHGPVRHVYSHYGRPGKRPGERILHSEGRDHWLYDWQAAAAAARADGWDAPPYDAPDRINRAVQADFDHLRGYLRGDWCYVGIGVVLASDAENASDTDYFSNAVWGVNDGGEHVKEVAREIAGDILHDRRQAWRAALTEARARKYWASRDVATV